MKTLQLAKAIMEPEKNPCADPYLLDTIEEIKRREDEDARRNCGEHQDDDVHGID